MGWLRREFRDSASGGVEFGCGKGTGRGEGELGTERGEDGWLGEERERQGVD